MGVFILIVIFIVALGMIFIGNSMDVDWMQVFGALMLYCNFYVIEEKKKKI